MPEAKTYKARFHHYGAMIDEMELLIHHYDPKLDKQTWIAQIIRSNTLGKNSRNWAREVISGAFYPRLVNGHYPDAWQHLRWMEQAGWDKKAIRAALCYHTLLSDELIYDFCTDVVYEKYFAGSLHINATDAYNFIAALPATSLSTDWTDYLKRRLSRGFMATLRDFGLLEGKAIKKIAAFSLPMETFLYIACLLQQQTRSGEKLVAHPDWKLFLLTTKLIERLFLDAHQRRLMQYHSAGAIIRIEFPYSSIEELIHAIGSGTTR
ncbi:MAG TPA: DUF1819 family protein [bacterium]|nr:DUF1819 family protein [bacterium]